MSSSDLSKLLTSIEAYEDLDFHLPLLDRISAQSSLSKPPIRFHTPSFKKFQTEELCSSAINKWPAVSITGSACKLQCDHCKANILKPMLEATSPAMLRQVVEEIIANGAVGMLLTGGSNHRNEVEYSPFLSVISEIKQRYPDFTIAVHTALVDVQQARALEQAGVDVAMLDIIGAQDTITQVYHLKRSVNDFEQSLEALSQTSMRVVPHIVIGLHYGHLLGEWQALEIIARHRVDALVLVVVMPQHSAASKTFAIPPAEIIGQFFLDARRLLGNTEILLGCARPPGTSKQLIDAYAVMAGLSGIAHPSEGCISLARSLGRSHQVFSSCCSIATTDAMLAVKGKQESISSYISVDSIAVKKTSIG
ncbi:MAG: radical SAM protein [Gammaproteobacteria bacterium]|nr:radical SAM protein [Gammaproteobacteria bacterium]